MTQTDAIQTYIERVSAISDAAAATEFFKSEVDKVRALGIQRPERFVRLNISWCLDRDISRALRTMWINTCGVTPVEWAREQPTVEEAWVAGFVMGARTHAEDSPGPDFSKPGVGALATLTGLSDGISDLGPVDGQASDPDGREATVPGEADAYQRDPEPPAGREN